jgi:hypothetical protein
MHTHRPCIYTHTIQTPQKIHTKLTHTAHTGPLTHPRTHQAHRHNVGTLQAAAAACALARTGTACTGTREAEPGGGAHVDASRWIRSSIAAAPAALRAIGQEGQGAPPRGVRRDSESAARALGHGVDRGW